MVEYPDAVGLFHFIHNRYVRYIARIIGLIIILGIANYNTSYTAIKTLLTFQFCVFICISKMNTYLSLVNAAAPPKMTLAATQIILPAPNISPVITFAPHLYFVVRLRLDANCLSFLNT